MSKDKTEPNQKKARLWEQMPLRCPTHKNLV